MKLVLNLMSEAVLYLCSDRARYVSGSCLTIDGAATAQDTWAMLQRYLIKIPPPNFRISEDVYGSAAKWSNSA